MIDIVPIGGLCNRMRVIDAGLELGRRTARPVRVHWMPGKELNCRFGELFMPIHDLVIVEGMMRTSRLAFRFGRHRKLMDLVGRWRNTTYYYWNENERLEQDVTAIGPIMQRRHAHIISYWRFARAQEPYRSFRPVPMLQDRVDAVTARFDQHTIGVHIRRTDNARAIARSGEELFIRAMDRRIADEPATRFYLATDCADTKRAMRERYQDRIISNDAPLDRGTTAGMQHAVVELYTLAFTRHVIGSFFSSYSTTAAEIGGVGLTVLDRQGRAKAI